MKYYNKKINILFVLPNFDTGGSEKLVMDLIRNLDGDIFNPVLCVFFTGKYEHEYLKLGYPFYVINKDNKISKIAVVKLLNRIIKENSIQIVNTHHTLPLIQGLLSFRLFNRVKWIHTEHLRLDHDPNVFQKFIRISKFCLKFVDVFLGISQGVCDYFKNEMNVPEKKIVKILNGVDIARFQFPKDEGRRMRDEYRKNLNIPQDDIVIGLFANFRKQKNHKCLIEAVKILKDEGINNFKIVLAGNGPEFENIKKVSETLDLKSEILFLGPRLDIPELMNMIDIYCLPSFFEGLPFSLMEAMAAGKAIVATDVAGNDEVVQNERNALLVDSDNHEELAERIAQLIDNREKRLFLSEAAVKTAMQFSFENMMNNYKELFLKI